VFLLGLFLPRACEALEISSVEVSSIGNYEYITIMTDGWATPKHTYLEDPNRLLLVFYGAEISGPIELGGAAESRIKSISAKSVSADPATVEVLVIFDEHIRYDIANMMGRNMTVVEFTGSAPRKKVKKEDVEVISEKEVKEKPIETAISRPSSEIPDLKKVGSFKIIVAGSEFRAGKSPLFSKGVLMVPARHFFEALEAQISFSKSGVLTIRRGDRQKFDYTIGSKVAKVNGKDFKLDAAPILLKKFTKKVAYVPLISTAGMMDYGAVWSGDENKLILSPRLKNVSFTGSDPSYALNMSFSDSIAREKFNVTYSGRLITVEVRDVLKGGDVEELELSGAGGVKRAFIEQKSSRLLSATILLDSQKPSRISYSDQGDEFSVLFSTAIYKLKPIKGDGWTRIEVYPNGPITFEVSEAKNPDRIILDFPNTILTAPSKIQTSDDFIIAAKASQFQFDPPTTRLVISTPKKPDFRTYLSDDRMKASIVVRWPKKVAKKPQIKKYNILKDKVIVIEPAHGGIDPGGTGYSGKYEKHTTLPLAFAISEVLEKAGATVLLTRERDVKVPRKNVVKFANNNKADIFISLHYNSFRSKYMSGTETYYYTPQSRLLAKIVHKNLVNGIKRKNRGIKRVMYYTIHHTTMPSVLVEPGFITNPTEEKLAYSSSFQKEVAFDILKGVVEYFKTAER
jgi:N-acetylmuramoyl-L-alanine amidase